ncbi:hypothetical protein BDV59DRAFT_178890 [Aspergillus ambiguus]|uniref:uncharacterized protein n=1 Tax=Aspergillus ambiguus TaxID=176160 RepID=UPI003CCDFD5D
MDGVLPSRFRDAAWERYTDVRDVLESEDDMTVVVRILKPMYRWQKFAPRAVEWVCKRLDEINEDLLRQPSTEEFHHAFFTSTEELETGVEDSQAGRDSIQETPAREEQPAPAEPQPEPEPAPASEPEPAPEPAPRRRDDHYSP